MSLFDDEVTTPDYEKLFFTMCADVEKKSAEICALIKDGRPGHAHQKAELLGNNMRENARKDFEIVL